MLPEEMRRCAVRVRELAVASSALETLPEWLGELARLKKLDLQGCTRLTGLPEGLSALTALQTLKLRRCKGLTGLPEGLSALTALQTLNLYGADLTGLKLLNSF